MTEKDERELNLVIEAYRRFRFENDGRWPRCTYTYYRSAEAWLKEQGCEVNFFKEDCNPRWESETRQIEFMLRWT